MPLETLFISGPGKGGKTNMARLIVDEALGRPVHYLRMRKSRDGHTNAVLVDPFVPGDDQKRWLSSHVVQYTPDRIFETLPEALRTARRIDRSALLLIEADGDPELRHAHPYDYRVFVMPAPRDVQTLFRDPTAAAAALHQVMQDTATFACEIFGIFDMTGLDDSVGVQHVEPSASRSGVYVEELSVDDQQVHQFLSSPLGGEIASRIQLQPDYHGLVESDITVINTNSATSQVVLTSCIERLQKLLKRVRQDARNRSVLYWGDTTRTDDSFRPQLIRRFKSLFSL